MSHSVSFGDYRAALTTPGARGPVLLSLLARLPIAMVGFALLLYVQREFDSFAVAGVVSAAALIGVAVGSVGQGRLMDRIGPTTPLYLVSGLFGLAVTVAIIAIELHAPVGVLAALSFLVGISQPTVGPASRSLWAALLPPGEARNAGYAYEAISMEVFFILGPGLAGLLVAMPWAGTGTVVGTVCMIIGSVGFASTAAARGQRPTPAERAPASLLGALASPGMRTVALASVGFGLLLGSVEVAVPAFTAAHQAPTLGGVLISAMSISSVIVGFLYGMRPWPRPMHLRLPVLLLGFAILVAALALPTTIATLCLGLLVAGSLITPQATAHSVALDVAAPAGTATEAFGWVITSVTLGAALGQSTSGYLVELSGPAAAFLTAGAQGALLALWLWLRRPTLRPTATTPEMALAGV